MHHISTGNLLSTLHNQYELVAIINNSNVGCAHLNRLVVVKQQDQDLVTRKRSLSWTFFASDMEEF